MSLEVHVMAIRTTWRKSEPQALQITGAEKDQFIRRAVGEIPDLGEEALARIAEHLCGLVQAITASRATVERYEKAPFDPNAFSAMKVYRTSGEKGLRERLNAIGERGHLQELAKAQQISLPRDLRGKSADPSALRDAIVKGVKNRHADWQAAS
jgi:hypothetical protein